MLPGHIFIVAAPSGAGKTTLVSALLAADPQVRVSVSFTTRAPRPGEKDGVDYHFVARATFEQMIADNAFIEYADVYGNFYGTSRQWLEAQLQTGNDILLEIDWQGAKQICQTFKHAIGIFILPPSRQILAQRLRGRGQADEAVIQRRLNAAREEIQHVDEYDYVIVNEFIDDAVRDIVGIVRAARLRLPVQMQRHQALIQALQEGTE